MTASDNGNDELIRDLFKKVSQRTTSHDQCCSTSKRWWHKGAACASALCLVFLLSTLYRLTFSTRSYNLPWLIVLLVALAALGFITASFAHVNKR